MADSDKPLELPPEVGFRSRGRPRLPPEEKRREKLVIALNAKELRRVLHAAADAPGGPQRIQDWARSHLLAAAPVLEEPECDPSS